MCSAQVALDPANLFGKREGGISYAGMIDPGGEITGSKTARKIADPAGMLDTLNTPVAPKPPKPTTVYYPESQNTLLGGLTSGTTSEIKETLIGGL